IKHINFRRSILSARAPAGSVKRKKGSDATVDISEIINGDPVKEFIIQVAALSWAATQVPEITVAIQSFLNTGFLSAVQLELSFMIGCLHLVTKAARSEFIVECDHGPPTGCTASFHTTRWGIVMRAAQSQALGSQPALAELCRLHWSPLCW